MDRTVYIEYPILGVLRRLWLRLSRLLAGGAKPGGRVRNALRIRVDHVLRRSTESSKTLNHADCLTLAMPESSKTGQCPNPPRPGNARILHNRAMPESSKTVQCPNPPKPSPLRPPGRPCKPPGRPADLISLPGGHLHSRHEAAHAHERPVPGRPEDSGT